MGHFKEHGMKRKKEQIENSSKLTQQIQFKCFQKVDFKSTPQHATACPLH